MNIRERTIKSVAVLSFLPSSEIDESSVLADIGIDSLKIVELIVSLEDELGIVFEDSDLDPAILTSVKSIINLVVRYANADE